MHKARRARVHDLWGSFASTCTPRTVRRAVFRAEIRGRASVDARAGAGCDAVARDDELAEGALADAGVGAGAGVGIAGGARGNAAANGEDVSCIDEAHTTEDL